MLWTPWEQEPYLIRPATPQFPAQALAQIVRKKEQMNRFLIARSALELFGCDYQENAFESTPVTWESQEPSVYTAASCWLSTLHVVVYIRVYM